MKNYGYRDISWNSIKYTTFDLIVFIWKVTFASIIGFRSLNALFGDSFSHAETLWVHFSLFFSVIYMKRKQCLGLKWEYRENITHHDLISTWIFYSYFFCCQFKVRIGVEFSSLDIILNRLGSVRSCVKRQFLLIRPICEVDFIVERCFLYPL